jgi:hypothetical protein
MCVFLCVCVCVCVNDDPHNRRPGFIPMAVLLQKATMEMMA